MIADDPDRRLRDAARVRGFRAIKSRRRKRGGDRGKWGLTDAEGKKLLGFGDKGFTATPDDLLAYLRDGEETAWKRSLRKR